MTLTAAVTIALGLAAPAGAAGGKAPAPCSLLTEKQVADLLGEPVEQPDDVLARFADDIPVPASFMSRTAFGTEYNGGGAFGGDLTIDEVVAYYQEALPGAGYEVGEPMTEDVDGVTTTVLPFSGPGRIGEIEISPNTDPPGATLLFISYQEDV